MTDATLAGGPGLLDRLAAGPVICAEGYLFEIERRGYLSAGAYVPEAVLEHPDTVARLHRDFLHAGSDVMLAFTYYAHREKAPRDRQGRRAGGDQPHRAPPRAGGGAGRRCAGRR